MDNTYLVPTKGDNNVFLTGTKIAVASFGLLFGMASAALALLAQVLPSDEVLRLITGSGGALVLAVIGAWIIVRYMKANEDRLQAEVKAMRDKIIEDKEKEADEWKAEAEKWKTKYLEEVDKNG